MQSTESADERQLLRFSAGVLLPASMPAGTVASGSNAALMTQTGHCPIGSDRRGRLESRRNTSRDISTIDRQTGASDEAGFGAGEVGHKSSNLFRLA